MLTESAILEHIRSTFPGGDDLTDDCGEIPCPPPGQRLLVSTDVMEEGQHFLRQWHPPAFLGRKLLTVNLSDLDASGATPVGFTLTLALGRDAAADWILAFLDGLSQAARDFQVPVLGGDTVGRAQGMGLGLTAYGHAARWLRRDALQVGHAVYVDQPLGASLRGFRKLQAGQRWDPDHADSDLRTHLDPRPNLGLGARLASFPNVGACIDISDGLSKDLRMLAEASQLSIVLSRDLTADEIQGGEDYARCFSSALPQPELEAALNQKLQQVGTVVPRSSGPLLAYDGDSLRPLQDLSFDHFAL